MVTVNRVAESESEDFVANLGRDGFEKGTVGLRGVWLGENLDVGWEGSRRRAVGVGLDRANGARGGCIHLCCFWS